MPTLWEWFLPPCPPVESALASSTTIRVSPGDFLR